MNFKGQYTIVGMLMTFVAIVVFVSLMPTLNTFIGNYTASSTDTAVNSVLNLMPFFILIAILMGALFYIMPHRETVPQG